MSIEIVMPKLSDTMEEGKILRWLKHAGDPIAAGDVIAEVETDKADMELEASESGVLTTIRVPEGESAAVGAVIAVLEGGRADVAPVTPAARPAAAASEATRKPASAATRNVGDGEDAAADDRDPATRAPSRSPKVAPSRPEPASATAENDAERPVSKASPAARTLAAEHGIDLATVLGSGPGGRVVSEDVEAAVTHARPSVGRPIQPAARPAGAPARREPAVVERHELSRMRQSIARRMSEAFREIPHFAVTAEIDMSEAVRLKAALEKEPVFDVPITYTHMVLKATARALTRHPRLNASYRDGALEVHAEVNLGMAVSVEDGLIVPVLRRADECSLAEIATEARRLVALTKQGKFASDDLSGGTFTVSNMGMLDIESFTAVINPPQSAILAVGAIKPRAVVRDGAVVAAHTMFVTVSCDHRIIDGVMAGRFLEELKTLLERPLALVIA
jgi:pyruvate dehydrogenase E2 component (dihydrolipoamide acetyltransferase)